MIYIVLIIVAALIALYFYFFLKRMCAAFTIDTNNKFTKLILGICAACLGALSTNVTSVNAIIVLHILAIALFMQLINWLVKLAFKKKYQTGFIKWKKVYLSGIIPIVLSAVILLAGYINMNNIVQTSYTVYTDKNIKSDGYKIALIADVHYGVSLDYDELLEIGEQISKNDVDAVVLCGDIVDDSTSAQGVQRVFNALSTIKSKYGTFYVYGNHDRPNSRLKGEYTADDLKNAIESNGITILKDSVYQMSDDFVIVGREDRGYIAGSNNRKTIDSLLKDVDKDAFVLTLDHQPLEYEQNANAGTDLLLSGHTHGGQLWPVNLVNKYLSSNEAIYGQIQIDSDTQAIVTSGFAGWRYPIKTSALAEYVIIDIKNK